MEGSGRVNARKHGITESSVLTILAEALGSFPQPSLPGGPLMSQAQSVFGKASLTGAWNGTVTLNVPVSVASSLTSALFAIPAGEISAADRADVVAELCNVVAGNLKGLIQGEVTLSLPTALEVNAGEAGSQIPPGSGAIAVDAAFPFLGQPIAVRIIEYPAP
jgi:CheY-specific phosphatase CheX